MVVLSKKMTSGLSNLLLKQFAIACIIILFITYKHMNNITSEFILSMSTVEISNDFRTESSHNRVQEMISKNSLQNGDFQDWVNDYIHFHNSAIEGGKLKDGFRYVVYRCSDKERCGGVGDRVLSMAKAFYFAISTGRVLLIDSKFPVELKNYLNPNFLQWDAEFPPTELILDDMNREFSIDRRENIIGYVLGRCNGIKRHSLTTIVQGHSIQTLLIQKNWKQSDSDFSITRAFHEAFWALFKFDDTVLSRAKEMQNDSGLAQPHTNKAHMQGSSSRVSYIGLHHRHGDSSIQGVRNPKKNGGPNRASNSEDLIKCYHTMRSESPDKYQAAYLASDDHNTKKLMRESDTTIHYPASVNIFHVDLSTREDSGVPSIEKKIVHQGVLDTWAEVAVLVDSDCLIMSRSMFAFLAYYIRGGTKCNMYLQQCNATTVALQINEYNTDPFFIIYPYWVGK